MSTKFTRKYLDTEVFGFHLYDDFTKPSGLTVRVNNTSVTIPLSKEEADEIEKDLENM